MTRTALTPSVSRMVGDFHTACDVRERDTPGFPDNATVGLRLNLIREELGELTVALTQDDLPEVADALADLIYVIYGMSRIFGIELDDVLAEVHRTNMAKVGVDGKVRRRPDEKILKPDGWLPPDITTILRDQGWTE